MNIKLPVFCCILFLLITFCTNWIFAQVPPKNYTVEFSNPIAPVGNPALTVPSIVKPVLDTWLRDTYITLGPDGWYYLTGTTAAGGRQFHGGKVHCWDYNDGIYLWRSKDMHTWEALGLIWSFDRDAAPWQKAGRSIPKSTKSVNGDTLDSMYRALWAPEIHYLKHQKKWVITACLNGGMGSFVLVSKSGKPEGPYENIPGNNAHAIFPNIDLSIFEDTDDKVYLLGHDHYIARMKNDLSDVDEPFRKLQETPYNPEPYIEGIYLSRHDGKYQLLQTVWSVVRPDGSYSYLRDEKKDKTLYSYDVVVAEADHIYGPYGPRYAAILQGGHNNIFQDKHGKWWSTTFFNPRGVMGTRFPVTCRAAVVPVKWVNGKLVPDDKRAKVFYANQK
ncbi:family 43 glycosylhydrolase [Mucilaginibacter sp. SMC90]|uniref:family 43 glycosylhydrolase n=1 Tax=Mucilaginibacter sp. SMC90 TaxID=2929803 RepID=UPI001FB43C75|nr:family 43 glycosylhydrolase [Mucilaginibacter sp. SMC90]UOE47455.1 family 43 glycosylhydrolase [Mucilaginibacter sp. SMC90]